MGATIREVEVCSFPVLPEHFDATVVPVDKPKGWSSFAVVKKVRWLTKVKKVGHAGTLDPMATGLLICLVGKAATKQMESFMHLPKKYEGVIRLGEKTPSYDAETEITDRVDVDHLTDEEIRTACDTFVGEIAQLPPMYSALKVGGERLYKKARRGEVIELQPRQVTITSFEISPRNDRDVSFSISCSKGTYIRSIAHDLGAYLGVGGHLVALRRTAIGPYSIDTAWPIDKFEEALLHRREG
ncbi:MAG: tRNA pseudouridine(55) synthase TruB [Rhodothermales bacterium]